MAKPNSKPNCEYVAIPLGSSSAAPVIRPGPRRLRTVADFASSFVLCWPSLTDFCDFGIHWLRLYFLTLLISSEMRGKRTFQREIFDGTTHLSIYHRRTDRFALCCPGRRPETEEFCRAFWRRTIRWTCHARTCR